MKLTLTCPNAEYREEMRIYCKKAGGICGHAFFKACKGWWALTPMADRCPLRQKATEPDRQKAEKQKEGET